jgi:hypothetical protein
MQNQLAVTQRNLDNYQAPPAAPILYLAFLASLLESYFNKYSGVKPKVQIPKFCFDSFEQSNSHAILNLSSLACVLVSSQLNYLREPVVAVPTVNPNNFNWLKSMHANKDHPFNCSKHAAKPPHYKQRALMLRGC